MTHKEIIESGLLELFALGQIDPADKYLVENAILQSEEVRNELREIENSLQHYAGIHRVEVSDGLLDKVYENIDNAPSATVAESSHRSSSKIYQLIAGMAAVFMIGALVWSLNRYDDLEQEYNSLSSDCESIRQDQEVKNQYFAALTDIRYKQIPIAVTAEEFQSEIVLYNNAQEEKNILMVRALPELASNEAIQLWSLKPDQAPIPLDVIQSDTEALVEVAFEDATATYAITIEDRAGAQTPNLDKLIGTFAVL